MTAKRTGRWLAVLVCAVSMIPAGSAAQDRRRSRSRDRDSSRPELAPLVNLFMERQSRTRLGLYLDARQSRRYDRDGALITGLMHDSPAEDAGLREGDIITVFEGHVLTTSLTDSELEADLDLDESLPAQRLLVLARDLEPGQSVEIRYLRDGANNTVTVEAEEFEFPRVRTFGRGQGFAWGVGPDGATWDLDIYGNLGRDMAERMRDFGDRLGDVRVIAPSAFAFSFGSTSVEGVEFIDLNPELGEYFGSETGVLVVEVDDESTLGLMAGDVVLAVGDREAETVGRLLRLIRSYEEDEPIRFRIIRRGSELVAEGFLQ